MADQIVIKSGSAEAVAFEIAEKIWNWENAGKGTPADCRAKFLALYAECLLVARTGKKPT